MFKAYTILGAIVVIEYFNAPDVVDTLKPYSRRDIFSWGFWQFSIWGFIGFISLCYGWIDMPLSEAHCQIALTFFFLLLLQK